MRSCPDTDIDPENLGGWHAFVLRKLLCQQLLGAVFRSMYSGRKKE